MENLNFAIPKTLKKIADRVRLRKWVLFLLLCTVYNLILLYFCRTKAKKITPVADNSDPDNLGGVIQNEVAENDN